MGIASGAFLAGVDFREARLKGADLGGARLQSAEWADVRNLTPTQLAQVIGNGDTILPLDAETGEQLYVWTCWPEPPPTLDGLLRHWLESRHDALRAEWLCTPGVAPERTGRPAAPAADPTGAD